MSGTTITGSIASFTIGSASYTLTNQGTIGGSAVAGVTATGSGDAVYNAGTIRGANFGIVASQYLAVVNTGAGALIAGAALGVALGGGGAIDNQAGATISGYNGVSLGAAGMVTNAAGGTIDGAGLGGLGIVLAAGGTVINAGSINAGRNTGVYLQDGGSFTNQTGGRVTAGYHALQGGAAANVVHGTVLNQGVLYTSPQIAYHQGVDLSGGSSLSNASGGTIVGYFGIAGGVGDSVVNDGTIESGVSAGRERGVQLFGGGSLTNNADGTITGEIGVWGNAPTVTVVNAGAINGPEAVYLTAGTFTNQPGGRVNGSILLEAGAATAFNAGSVSSAGAGFIVRAGIVTNEAQGTVSGASGAMLSYSAVLTNSGSIAGTNLGVEVYRSGTLINSGRVNGGGVGATIYGFGNMTNAAAGTIAGGNVGVGVYAPENFIQVYYEFYPDGYQPSDGLITNAGLISGTIGVFARSATVTVFDSGTIAGSSTAVAFAAGYNDRLVLYPGASLIGTVAGAGGVLELSTGASAGTLGGFGTQIAGFSQVIVDPGAYWTLQGANTLTAGTRLINSGTLQIAGSLGFAPGGGGRLVLQPGGTIVGAVDGGGAPGIAGATLELVSAASVSTLNGLGSRYLNFGPVLVDPGAYWVLDPNTLASGLTLTNQGTVGAIDGTSVVFQPGTGNRVILYGGASFLGTVDGGNAPGSGTISALELAGSTPATLTGLGSKYVNFGLLDIDSGATWTLGTTLAAGTTLIDAGYLTGSPYAVQFGPGGGSRLVLLPSATISGVADGGDAGVGGPVSTLELASAAGRGELTGIGTQFVGFAQVTVDPGAYWVLSGTNTLAAGVTLAVSGIVSNAGTLIGNVTLPGGTLLNSYSDSTIIGVVTGDASISNSGTILGSDGVAVSLSGGSDVVSLYPGGTFGGTVYGGGSGLLVLGYGGTPGTLQGFGTQYTGFSQLEISSSAKWDLGGDTLAAGTTLTNMGTAAGNILFQPGAGNRVVNGGTFLGTVNGGNPIGGGNPSTLELAAHGLGSAGTLNGLGSKYLNFASVVVDPDTNWNLAGVNTVAPDSTLLVNGYLYNGGTVAGNVTLGIGRLTNNALIDGSLIGMEAGVQLSNPENGTINAATGAAVSFAAGGYVRSYGLISAAAGDGVVFGGAPASLYNGFRATITAGGTGVFMAAGGSLDNGGDIYGTTGVLVAGSSATSIENEQNSVIAGTTYGVRQQGSGALTLENVGYIEGGIDAVSLASGAAGLVQIYPGASFGGLVDGGNAAGSGVVSTLELLARYNPLTGPPGTLTGLGSKYINFGEVIVDPKAIWTVTGNATLAGLTNSGTLTLNSDLVAGTLSASAASAGTIVLGNGVTLEAIGSVSGQAIVFAGNGVLRLDNPGSVYPTVLALAPGETIDLRGVDPASVRYAYQEVFFTAPGGTARYFPLSFAAGKGLAPVTSDGAGGADVTAICFCAGTRILTPSCEVAVERLAAGDTVVTASGAVRPIVWIGTGQVLATPGRRGPATPVIVRKGALADNVPHRDLHVTKGHSLLLDGVLIPVEFLVNHHSILWDDRAQQVTIYHIELTTHDVLLADGAPAESYRDDGNRWMFGNANAGWDAPAKPPCAEVLTGGPVVDAIWRRLADRAGRRQALPLTDDPDLHLLADGRRVSCALRDGAVYVFRLPEVPRELRIASRAGAPQELGVARDPRVLGVALRRIVLARGARLHVIQADDPQLTDGFHGCEMDRGTGMAFRWTNGDAVLPQELLAGWQGALQVELYLTGATNYVADAVADCAA